MILDGSPTLYYETVRAEFFRVVRNFRGGSAAFKIDINTFG